MVKIKDIYSREILDSRGHPTLETTVFLEGGFSGTASVPSGVSVGKYEALELRDNEASRYHGLGVLKAVENVNQIIKNNLKDGIINNQLELDQKLILLDSTPNKSKLGANTILSVSEAFCKAVANAKGIPLYQQIANLFGLPKENFKIPRPIFVMIDGGKHGAGNLDFQEFQIIPSSSKTYSEALRIGEEIYQTTKQVLIRHEAIHSVGDEGGFAPNLFTNLDAFEVLVEAIKKANFQFRQDVFFGLDVAASHFYQDGRYSIKDRTMPLVTDELLEFYKELVQQYPLMIIEDPFYEDDWSGWTKLAQVLPETIIVGDDLLVTNKDRVKEAIKKKACSAILIKPNQIGTTAETIEVIKICRAAGWKIVVSHRGGETNDDFIADFSVGVGADFVKFGAPARGERVAKYNRLLKIEEEIKHA